MPPVAVTGDQEIVTVSTHFDRRRQMQLLSVLRSAGMASDEALAAYLRSLFGQGDRTHFSRWRSGEREMPASVLLSLLEFCPELLDYLAGLQGRRVVTLPEAEGEGTAVELHALHIAAEAGQLSRLVAQYRSPESASGVALSADERAHLSTILEGALARLLQAKEDLEAQAGPRAVSR